MRVKARTRTSHVYAYVYEYVYGGVAGWDGPPLRLLPFRIKRALTDRFTLTFLAGSRYGEPQL